MRDEIKVTSETYKVLAAMYALQEFDAQALARASDVRLSTVHGVLRRHRGWYEGVGVVRTGKRGGQVKRYRLRDEMVPAFREALARAYEELPASEPGPVEGSVGDEEDLPGLVAARYLLDEALGASSSVDDRTSVLRAAASHLAEARRDLAAALAAGAVGRDAHELLAEKVERLEEKVTIERRAIKLVTEASGVAEQARAVAERATAVASAAVGGMASAGFGAEARAGDLEEGLDENVRRLESRVERMKQVIFEPRGEHDGITGFVSPPVFERTAAYPHAAGQSDALLLVDLWEEECSAHLLDAVDEFLSETERVLVLRRTYEQFRSRDSGDAHLGSVPTIFAIDSWCAKPSARALVEPRLFPDRVPVLVLDAHSDISIKQRVLEAGAVYVDDVAHLSSQTVVGFISSCRRRFR